MLPTLPEKLSWLRQCIGAGTLIVLFLPVPGHAYEMAPNGAVVPSTCNGGTLPVCGFPIPMPATTSVGNTAEVHVPHALLGTSGKTVSFTVACVDNGYGGGVYQTTDSDPPSCNMFPCQASAVRLCDTNIPVDGGTPLGGVVHLTYENNPFTVTCVGSQASPPTYQISDHSAIVCPATAQ